MLHTFLLIWLGFMLIQLLALKKNKHVHFSDFLLLRVYLVLNYCFSLILIFPFLTLITLLTEHQPLFFVYSAYFICILIFNLLYFWFIQQTLSHPVTHHWRLFIWIFFPHLIIFICLMTLFLSIKNFHF